MSDKAATAPMMPSGGGYKGRPLGRILIRMGKVNRNQVHEALQLQKSKRGPIGQILIDLGYITEQDLQFALAAQIGMDPIDLDKVDIDVEVIKMLTSQVANTYKIIPVAYDKVANTLSVAMSSPDNFHACDDLRLLMGFNVKSMITTADCINNALNRYYPEKSAESINDLIDQI